MKNSVLVLFCACILCACEGGKCNKKLQKPADLQPINWESYNDVKTVYYNTKIECEGFDESLQDHPTIKICGWAFKNDLYMGFALCDNPDGEHTSVYIEIDNEYKPETLSNKKYYVTGKLDYNCESAWCYSRVRIFATDIYTE
ncbi:MAG: hypothetical protein LBS50_11845 [Prevotellaceae bacterium]|jgi:hypothetical protein|nr:hypothetical protein [Prevotellaceae bacterium]